MPEGAQAGYLKALFSQDVFSIFTCHVQSLSASFFSTCQRQRTNNYTLKFEISSASLKQIDMNKDHRLNDRHYIPVLTFE